MRYLLGTLAVLLLSAAPARAAVITDFVTFPAGTAAQDTTSGNHTDYSYLHQIPDLTIISGTLTLKHSGNSDEGPTREIWHLMDADGFFVGRLTQSDSMTREDFWELPQETIQHINARRGMPFAFLLSEQTSFNSEKIDLFHSVLKLTAASAAPAVPEPSGLWLLITAFVLAAGIKKAEPFKRAPLLD